MRTRAKSLLLVTLSAAAAWSTGPAGFAAPAVPLMHRIYAGEPDSRGWALAESTAGNFSVRMPGPFNDFSVPADPAQGTQRTEGIGGKSPDGIVFSALQQVFASKDEAKMEFDSYQDGGGLPAAKTKSSTVGGAAALDIAFSDTTAAGTQRVMLIGENLYILNVKWPLTAASAGGDMSLTFIDSFRVLVDHAVKPSTTAIWQPNQMNETYMRTLTKDECMNKTVATLGRSGCASKECQALIAGATGNCVTWAAGDKTQFCATYERRYVTKPCGNGDLNGARCSFLGLVRDGICGKNN